MCMYTMLTIALMADFHVSIGEVSSDIFKKTNINKSWRYEFRVGGILPEGDTI